MRDLNTLTFHPTFEKIVGVLCRKTQNDNPEFFRILLSYHAAKVASTMRVKVLTKDRGKIPINLYAINLAPSGYGKGHSTNIIEEQILNQFRERFMTETYPVIVEESLTKLAIKRAYASDEDEETVLGQVKSEFSGLGELLFSFDSGTPAAIKQMRHKLLMGGAGAMNLEIDEIGSNLLGSVDALNTFLELFDVGKLKQKLLKNTKESIRLKEIEGRTPANLIMFGTQAKVFDGAKVEEEVHSLLDTGYARRCIYGFCDQPKRKKGVTAEQIFKNLTDSSVSTFLQDISIKFAALADITNHNKVIPMSEDVSIELIKYKMYCEDLADKMPEHQQMHKAEMLHRYFKTIKIAGTYAFIDGDPEVTEDNLYHAICMVEESGKAFNKIMQRDRPYMKLAKYLGGMPNEVTHADLQEDLPFYKGSVQAKSEMLQLAAAWGYKNDILIKRSMVGGIEFFKGESLEPTDLNKIRISYSKDISDGYINGNVPFKDLHKLTQQPMMHWITHHSVNGHRSEDFLAKGFNLVVLDIDGGTSIQEVKAFFKEYKYLLYTTKRHTPKNPRFRVVMPTNYLLHSTATEYTELMKNLFEWIPFTVDDQTSQRSRKWLTNQGNYFYSTGKELIDIRPFIPRTARNDEHKQFINTYQSMTNMERWFLRESAGNRNNQLSRYAFLMVDIGYDFQNIRDNVLDLNKKLPDPLKVAEIDQTIMRSTAQKIAKLQQP